MICRYNDLRKGDINAKEYAYKNNKHQDSKNRLNTVIFLFDRRFYYQSQSEEACDSCNTQEMVAPQDYTEAGL